MPKKQKTIKKRKTRALIFSKKMSARPSTKIKNFSALVTKKGKKKLTPGQKNKLQRFLEELKKI